ncbi:hypothetical protein SOVF_074640, partial [Spinacia oleracea]
TLDWKNSSYTMNEDCDYDNEAQDIIDMDIDDVSSDEE